MLTQESIREMAEVWYRKLDIHAPMVEILPFLVDDGLEMVFPEATIYGWAGFEGWYQGVIRIFFDEVHTVKVCDSEIDGDEATTKVVVQWEASVWKPPAEKSERIVLDAYQTWEVVYQDGTPKVKRYVVDELKYHEGSAKL
ncbi:MAG: hypothetical protein MK226_08810 [Saprospiraceae bacterium]|nr:hypothetical protein [Saprospiraceae bacterium]